MEENYDKRHEKGEDNEEIAAASQAQRSITDCQVWRQNSLLFSRTSHITASTQPLNHSLRNFYNREKNEDFAFQHTPVER